ncbi:hypothetical protein [Arthrobacter sp. M4]|uniref:hypothetical protein n=1 Tax=Arthrobacter sp. M4 TaxID=218160 RepID=UPI001CDD88E3|nr:hypothetical protein [Arthrobacter sp. M4]MCA4131781.1 hypothetical protein [Arthrobacter sp. M4]
MHARLILADGPDNGVEPDRVTQCGGHALGDEVGAGDHALLLGIACDRRQYFKAGAGLDVEEASEGKAPETPRRTV